MSIKKTVFCEMAFWDKFSESYPSSMPFPDENTQETLKCWIETYSFLCRSDIHIDRNDKEFALIASKDPRLFHLWKKTTEGVSHLYFEDRYDLEPLLSKNPLSVLLTGSGKGPLSRKYGIININGGNCLHKGRLYIDNGPSIRIGDRWDWEEFKKLFPDLSSNSMVIVDNYIMKNGKHDLPTLLNILLPDTCEIGYHLTIFYYEPGSTLTREDLMNAIRKYKPNLQKNLLLETIPVIGTTDFHDRAIITNNLWFFAGGGFDLTRPQKDEDTGEVWREAKRSTTLEIVYPCFASNNLKKVDDAYLNLIADAQRCLELKKMKSNNRLLSKRFNID